MKTNSNYNNNNNKKYIYLLPFGPFKFIPITNSLERKITKQVSQKLSVIFEEPKYLISYITSDDFMFMTIFITSSGFGSIHIRAPLQIQNCEIYNEGQSPLFTTIHKFE